MVAREGQHGHQRIPHDAHRNEKCAARAVDLAEYCRSTYEFRQGTFQFGKASDVQGEVRIDNIAELAANNNQIL